VPGKALIPAHVSMSDTSTLTATPTVIVPAQVGLVSRSELLGTGKVIGKTQPLPPPRLQPTWQRDVQHFAISQERQRHVQALWQYGELCVFALMWTTLDFQAGLVGRCQRCFSPSAASVEQQISAAYGQGNQYKCPDCFGTQFEGGFRALIVRPAIFTDMDKNQAKTAKGVMNTGQLSIESTPDFRVRPGDYCFRQTGDRFYLRVPRRVTLRTGFGSAYQGAQAIDYNVLQASLEETTSVAYSIPPAADALADMLGVYTRLPADFSWFETIRAPLIPVEQPPLAAAGKLQGDSVLPPPPSTSLLDVEDEGDGLIEDESGAPVI
jgi:hypothetical protein